jgi:toxin FitB
MNVVDSSGWIEYFTGGPNAVFFTPPIENVGELIVPALVICEVFKWVLRERGERQALQVVVQMGLGEVVDLNSKLAINAARAGVEHKMPLGDSIIFATAQSRNATVWTQDVHFKGLEGVKFVEKQKK